MNNPIPVAALMTIFCFVLSGCAIGSKSTDLEYVPAKPDETRLLKPIGYVFHDEAYSARNKRYIESEKRSWIIALTSFTDQENIFTMADGKPTRVTISSLAPAKTRPIEPTLADLANDYSVPKDIPKSLTPDNPATPVVDPFTEFAKTHPIVDVYIKAAPAKNNLTLNDALYGPPIFISFFSFGMIPAYYPLPYIASFTLSMPDEKLASTAHWDYAYLRQEYYWFPLLIPVDGYISSFSSVDEIDRWKVEEKRRLVLMFLHDAKAVLQQH